jgi:hypothetical protein
MEVLELKKKIHDAIDLEDDMNRLHDLHDWMVAPHPVLSDADKAELIDMATHPEKYKWYSHEEVMTKLKKWREK